MPVIYLADGESATAFARTLQPLIESGQSPPIMIVGLHSGSAAAGPDDDTSMIRSREYLWGLDTGVGSRFSAHERFLIDEVMPLAESLGASSRPEHRAVAGFSNGAAWAMAMATDHPELFGKVLALSFGWNNEGLRERIRAARFGDVYLGAGTLEDNFHSYTAGTAKALETRADRVTFDSRVAGHSPTMWREQFPLGVLWLFNPDGDRFDPVAVRAEP